ncbi:MAG: family 16 glycoside hydrolase [Phycisphaeraceae bacterium]
MRRWIPQVCLVLAAIAAQVGSPAFADPDAELLEKHGIEPTAASLRSYLRQFTPTAQQQKSVTKLIAQLGDDDFDTREKAHTAINALPVLPRQALNRAAASSDAEVKWRAEKLLQRDDEPQQRVLQAALNAIDKHRLKGLAGEMVQSFSFLVTPELRSAARRALVTTATADDHVTLAALLKDSDATTRALGVAALGAAVGKGAIADLKPLLNDASEQVQLAAARVLGDLGERACIDTLVRLLESKTFAIEWEAERSLRWLRGKGHEVDAKDEAGRKQLTLEAWKAWAAGEGKTAKLNFPIQLTGEIVLFNGIDLAGWQAVHDGQRARAEGVWSVKDGVLQCSGSARGYLRTMRSFRDYELNVEWRWPGNGGDSGIWLMIGSNDAVQPKCIEMQLLHQKAGDFWLIGGFSAKAQGKAVSGYVARKGAASEKALGQWNQTRIRVHQGKVTVTINDVLQNEVTDCQHVPGCIALQTEGTAIEFRKVVILPLD